MSEVPVRGLDPATLENLKRRARRKHRSLQAELKSILEQVAANSTGDLRTTMKRVQALFAGRTFSDSAALIRRDRSR